MLVGQHKVDTMFGYPGGAILPVFDELYKTPAKFILNRHEQAWGHCADGYCPRHRQAGCLHRDLRARRDQHRYAAGDGADGQHSDHRFSAARCRRKVIGNDAFQEADVTGITRPCTKWNYLVKDIRELPRVVNEAFLIATTGRPGPVLIDLPKDVTAAICPDEVDDTPRQHIAQTRKT